MRFIRKNFLLNFFYESAIIYPAPANLTFFWNFGSLALFALFVQIISGVFLGMHYIASPFLAFESIEHIMRDVSFGWLLRYVHANGASLFFLFVYIHMFRGLYYGSYLKPRESLWLTGVFIFLLMILTAFLGYVLPWGQMSYWAATVITNLLSTVPVIGKNLVFWLWGGYSVGGPTLTRFFSLHYLLPFILLGLIVLHLLILHETGSNNLLGTKIKFDRIPFHPYYTIKDIFGLIVVLVVYLFLIFIIPNFLGHPDNYIEGNPCITPTHIVPEWYFLPFYAILRSVPHKLFGVVLLLLAIFALIILPYLTTPVIRTGIFRPFYKFFCLIFVFNYLLLGWIGSKTIEQPFYLLGQISTFVYFTFFFVIIIISQIENTLLLSVARMYLRTQKRQ